MNIKLLIPVILIVVVAAGYLALQNGIPDQFLPEVASTKVSQKQAVENVKKLPEVIQYLKDVPNGKVEVDNELEGEYNVHVYEVKNGHTATFNWYQVSIKSGEVRSEFPKESNAKTGTVFGKLCYPSEFLPKGTIEAKRLSDQKTFSVNYGGSEAGQGNRYEFPLEDGDYYLRYKTQGNQIGYSTTVCPTGQEETCGDKNLRVLRKVELKSGQIASGYDLCDFYYTDSNAPKF